MHWTTVRSWEAGRTGPKLAARPGLYAYLGFYAADPSASLGTRLQLWREAQGVPRQVVADRLGMDETTLWRLEKDEAKSPTVRVQAAVELLIRGTASA